MNGPLGSKLHQDFIRAAKQNFKKQGFKILKNNYNCKHMNDSFYGIADVVVEKGGIKFYVEIELNPYNTTIERKKNFCLKNNLKFIMCSPNYLKNILDFANLDAKEIQELTDKIFNRIVLKIK